MSKINQKLKELYPNKDIMNINFSTNIHEPEKNFYSSLGYLTPDAIKEEKERVIKLNFK